MDHNRFRRATEKCVWFSSVHPNTSVKFDRKLIFEDHNIMRGIVSRVSEKNCIFEVGAACLRGHLCNFIAIMYSFYKIMNINRSPVSESPAECQIK